MAVEVLRGVGSTNESKHLDQVNPVSRAYTSWVATSLLSHKLADQVYRIVTGMEQGDVHELDKLLEVSDVILDTLNLGLLAAIFDTIDCSKE